MTMSLHAIDFPLHGNRLIEASAGTGKTWTIAALYVRLILGHGSANGYSTPLLPTDILVVTFTEAATAELRDRIRKRLHEVAEFFRHPKSTPDDFLMALAADYPDPSHRAQQARRLEVAADWMDEASIYTIHSWCSRMLKQHAFDTGSLFTLEIESDEQQLLEECTRDYWRQYYYPLDALGAKAVASLARTPDDLLDKIRGLLKHPEAALLNEDRPLNFILQSPKEQLITWCEWAKHEEALIHKARADWINQRSELEHWIRSADQNGWLNKKSYQNLEARLSSMSAWAERDEPVEEKHQKTFASGQINLVKAHAHRVPDHSAFRSLDNLVEHRAKTPDYTIGLLQHAAQAIHALFTARKEENARLDFDDLIHQLDRALKGPNRDHLKEVIRKQYPVVLMDEFQDTDPIQYQIFEALYGEANALQPTAWLMIGDPKQAIYSFRGADIFTYLKAKRTTKGHHYTLNTNRRSTSDYVAAVNHLFAYAEQQPDGAFRFLSQGERPIPYNVVSAHGLKEHLTLAGTHVTPLNLWSLNHHQEKALSIKDYRLRMASVCAMEIIRFLDAGQWVTSEGGKRGVMPSDIAILVRDRNEALDIRRALANVNLRSVYLSDRDSVFETIEAHDLLVWLKAVADPQKERRLRAALATQSLRRTYAELDHFTQDEEAWEQQIERFIHYKVLWQEQGPLPMLRRFMMDFEVPSRVLSEAEGERSLTNLLHLAELLQVESVQLDGEFALIRYLADILEQGQKGLDDTILRLESDEGLIRVVTIHKSKGLEYPLVFLPFICSFKEVSGKHRSFYAYHNQDEALCFDLAKSATAKDQADFERLQEDLRLLYVALTRARHASWLGLALIKTGKSKASMLDKSAMGSLLGIQPNATPNTLWNTLAFLVQTSPHLAIIEPDETRLPVTYKGQVGEPILSDARHYQGQALDHWWIASYSALKLQLGAATGASTTAFDEVEDSRIGALTQESREDVSITTAQSDAKGLHAFPAGTSAGVFLHTVLEWAAQKSFKHLRGRPNSTRSRYIQTTTKHRGYELYADLLDEWLCDFLEAPLLNTPDSSLGHLPKKAYQAELEFWIEAKQVEVKTLDDLITNDILKGQARPALMPNTLNGMLKGFIDLVFEYQGRYYVLDYKSNRLGRDLTAYSDISQNEVILEKRYDVQYTLYLLALHRHLKSRLGEAYDYDLHIGGAVYVFLRGIDQTMRGIHHQRPSKQLIDAIDALFKKQSLC